MALNYEKFCKLIPGNTLKFLNVVLPDLRYYVTKNNSLNIGSSYITDNNMKIFLIFLNGLRKMDAYNNVFGLLKIKEFSYKNKDGENKDKIKQFYDDNAHLFELFEDEIDYTSLTPLKLVYYQTKNLSSYNKEFFCNITSSKKEAFDKLKDLVSEEEKNLSERIKKDICSKIPIQLISYLECASKIRAELFSRRSSLNKEYFSSIDDINIVSLFLALYFYSDVKSDDIFFINERDILKKVLKDAGVDLDGIKRVTGLNITNTNVSNHEVNYFAINESFKQYFEEDVKYYYNNTICNIIRSILNRKNNNNNIVLEKIFLHLNCYLNMIDLSDDALNRATEEEKERIINDYTKAFYSDLSWQVREFINFTAKAYSLILAKMRSRNIDGNLVKTEDDADTLALYIASHYYDGDVDLFFASHGASYEKVLEMLKLKISKEDIEKMPLDVKALVERFKRFVYEGVNTRQNSKNLTITDVIHNLCDKKFNCSSIMNDIFNGLSNKKIDLEDDFLSQLKKYFEDREKAMKEELKAKFFHEMPLDTVSYLENVSGIYSVLSKTVNYEKNDLICFSLLLGIFIKDRSEICKVFNSLGFDYKKIVSSLGLSSSKKWDDPNIQILSEHFNEYIFGGVNKDLKREDITIKQIVKNIFNKELNDSLYIRRLLNDINLSYSTFDSFDELYDETLKNIETSEKLKKLENKISYTSNDTSTFIRYTLRIFNELKRGISSEMVNASLVTCPNDLIELSLVLATLAYHNNSSRFFEKYGITFERGCEYLGIDPYVLLDIAQNATYNALDLTDYFEKYMFTTEERINNIDNIINSIFDERLSSSLVLENVCNNFGISYPILKREVLSKKDYEDTLSIEERTELLLSEKVDELVISDNKSLLRYGNDLGSHSKYIFNELPRLELNDTNDSSIIEIKSSLDKLYLTTEPQKKGLLARLFPKKSDDNERTINEDSLRILKSQIDEKIQILNRELDGYHSIREYMEAYRKKNKEYLIKVSEILKSLEEPKTFSSDKVEELNEKLKYNEVLCSLRSKAERFLVSDQLYERKLIEISQRIIAHNLTINSLEMAYDIFIPLVVSQLAIEKGASTSNSSLEITDTVIDLFESLLIKNAESTLKNMEKLKRVQINGNLLDGINARVDAYLGILKENTLNTGYLTSNNIGEDPGVNPAGVKKLTLPSYNPDNNGA